jgi:CheY-like chemotaxis protein
MKILIVDDDATCLESYVDALKLLGHEPVPSEDGLQALQLCQRQALPLVLSDIRMPKMDGIQLLQALRADPKLTKTDVVFLTGNADVASAAEAVRQGAFDYLLKPVVIEDLQRVLERWMQKHPVLSDSADDTQLFHSFTHAMVKERRFLEPELAIEGLARSLHTNRSYLSRMINHRFGVGFSRVTARYRLEEFQRITGSEPTRNYTLDALAKMCGFPSKSSLHRACWAEFGCPPGALLESSTAAKPAEG